MILSPSPPRTTWARPERWRGNDQSGTRPWWLPSLWLIWLGMRKIHMNTTHWHPSQVEKLWVKSCDHHNWSLFQVILLYRISPFSFILLLIQATIKAFNVKNTWTVVNEQSMFLNRGRACCLVSSPAGSEIPKRSVWSHRLFNVPCVEEILHHLGCLKPYKSWDKPPINLWFGFLPPTVSAQKCHRSAVQALLGAGLRQVQCPSVKDQRIELARPQNWIQIL